MRFGNRLRCLAALSACILTPPAWSADDSGSFKVVADWPKLPVGRPFGEVAGVGVDSHNHIFVFHRGDYPIRCIEAESGAVIKSWGNGMFVNAHGLAIDDEDNVWVTDTRNHQVFKFTHDGELLMTVGEKGVAGLDATHFDQPTDVVVTPNGEFYVSDGYGNSRVAKFSADGKFLFDWGKKGTGPGEFDLPHGITRDSQGRIYVADRSNFRIQVFDADGKFLHEWKSERPGRPWGLEIADDGYLYVMDGGDMIEPSEDTAKILKLDLEGKVIEQWGAYGNEAGQFSWGHDVAVGRDGAVYAVEVRNNYRLQKFVRQ